jgi:hypothetical protein
MINIIPYQILVYNDVPQLFLAKDQIGANYLCMAIESKSKFAQYFAIPISFQKLNHLIKGNIDLRSAFERSETGIWYIITVNEQNEFISDAVQFDKVDEQYLPSGGFYFPGINLTIDSDFFVDEFSEKLYTSLPANNFMNSLRKSEQKRSDFFKKERIAWIIDLNFDIENEKKN